MEKSGSVDDPVAVILAAGKSTRMKSALPKVLHDVCGRPMIEYVLDAARSAGVKRIVVIVGYQAEHVQEALSQHRDVEFALQSEQMGTGHAVMMSEPHLGEHRGPVLVLAGDTPLLRGESLAELLEVQRRESAACVIGTAVTEANEGLGRIVRDAAGAFLRIVEQKDATSEEAAIQEINTGCYAFDGPALFDALHKVRPNNRQSEYYLTDCPAIMKDEGRRVIAAATFDIHEAMGVNTRSQLAHVQKSVCQAFLEKLMVSGVTVVAPELTYIEPGVTIGPETVIHPFTSITGRVRIGERCQIGPHAVISGEAVVADETVVGPFQAVAGP